MVGEPATATAAASNYNPKHTLNYTWSSTGGQITGKDNTASINTNGVAGGRYTVTAQISDPRRKKGGEASCMASFTVKEPPKNPPIVSCSADPSTVQAGTSSTISCTCTSPDNVPVTVVDHNGAWILDQVERVERLRTVWRPEGRQVDILFRGEPTKVRVETTETRARGNLVEVTNGTIVVRRGTTSQTPVARSLENWLRKQARAEFELRLAAVTMRLGQNPRRVYVMGQRTKWGGCSARRNLSFNWRLILAPDFVLQYLVTHEAVHLAVPDHSARFWLDGAGPMSRDGDGEAVAASEWAEADYRPG